MKRQKLTLYTTATENTFRTVIKTSHGRLVYIAMTMQSGRCRITSYYYIDRIRGGKYYAVPQKLITLDFNYSNILTIIRQELDRQYSGVEISDLHSNLSTDDFIQIMLSVLHKKYNFLIMVGCGDVINGIPSLLKTRFKNRIHRSIYLELSYYKDNMGVVAECYYCDRLYKQREKVMPETLTSVFFDYNREAIIGMINRELNTAFTHVIFVTDGSIDIKQKMPLCGNV